MLDFDPLVPIPGQERPPESSDPDAFVAKLRYQQTKVDGVLPTILVEQAVVSVIGEQQAWISQRYPDLTPKYLFLGVRHQHQGQRPRTYHSYREKLSRLDRIHGLTDTAGRPLRFSQTRCSSRPDAATGQVRPPPNFPRHGPRRQILAPGPQVPAGVAPRQVLNAGSPESN